MTTFSAAGAAQETAGAGSTTGVGAAQEPSGVGSMNSTTGAFAACGTYRSPRLSLRSGYHRGKCWCRSDQHSHRTRWATLHHCRRRVNHDCCHRSRFGRERWLELHLFNSLRKGHTAHERHRIGHKYWCCKHVRSWSNCLG